MDANPEYNDAKGRVLICEPDAYKCINVGPPPIPRSKLHHVICTVGVEKAEPIKVRVISDNELESVEKRSSKP